MTAYPELEHYPIRMPWDGHDVPNAVIEVNQACNLKCDGCYKDKSSYEKPLEQVMSEIDLVMSKRNLSVITIAGGEPTMYSQLPEVIAYITERGVRSVILTNGSLLTRERLEAYKAAGLGRVTLHIDCHQRRRPDVDEGKSEQELNQLRLRYLDMCREVGIPTGLELTLYKDNLDQFQDVVEFAQRLDHDLVGILVTNYAQTLNIEQRSSRADDLTIRNDAIIRFMKKREGADPIYYVGSSTDLKALRWLFYTAAVTVDDSGRTHKLYLDPKHRTPLSFFIRVDRRIKGRFSIEDPRTTGKNYLALALYGLLSASPGNLIETTRFIWRALRNRNIKFFSMVFQDAPTIHPDGTIETCHNCPDATVRNGKIIPVCLVDQLEPLAKSAPPVETTNGMIAPPGVN